MQDGKSLAEGYAEAEEPSAPRYGLTNVCVDKGICYIIRTFNLGLGCLPSSRSPSPPWECLCSSAYMQHPSIKTLGTGLQLIYMVSALCAEQEMEQNRLMDSYWK